MRSLLHANCMQICRHKKENGLTKPNGVNLKRLAFLFSQRYQETEVEIK